VDEFFRLFVSETTNQNYVMLYTSDHGQTLAEHGQAYTHMKPDPEIVDVPDFLVSGERYGNMGLLDGIAPGIRVSHLNNFAALLDLMGVPASFAGSSLRQIDFHFDGRGQPGALLHERLSLWIGRLRGEEHTCTTKSGVGRFENLSAMNDTRREDEK